MLDNYIIEKLKTIRDQYTELDIVKSGHVVNAHTKDDTTHIDLTLGYPAKAYHETLRRNIENVVSQAKISIDTDIGTHSVQEGIKPLPKVKNIIAIASGKGGVGKSTVSTNLALAIAQAGAKVGLLDADIYGPSQPRMLGLTGRPKSPDKKSLEPMKKYGLQVMSIGFLIEEDTPMIWRGPMVTQALEQLLRDTLWVDLDYLIIDMPPGTGDIQLTLAQKVPVTSAIIVTTPQDIALLDARKAYKMFEKVRIPILGLIENMQSYVCTACGHKEHIFGYDGGLNMAKEYQINYLGGVPLNQRIREDLDQGTPTVIKDPNGEIAQQYANIAYKATAQLSLRQQDTSAKFPNIVVKQN